MAWKRLERIHDCIDIMLMTMVKDDDPTTRKDGRRLSKINLNEEEWDAIKQLIKVLEPFALGTQLLEGSKYVTISFMYDAITEIKNGVYNTDDMQYECIDLIDHTMVFDDDVGIEDSDNDDEVDDHPKRRKILINTPQDCKDLIEKVRFALYTAMNHYWCVSKDEGMVATLLDPRCKSLNFANESQKNQTKDLLREIYNEKKQELGVIQQVSQLPGNPLLQNMFTNHRRHERLDEIEQYMMIKEIDVNTCPFKWWSLQKSRFPILSQLAKKYLAIPATFAASERLFSDAGNVITARRINLLPSTFEHLIFCKRNRRLVGSIFPES